MSAEEIDKLKEHVSRSDLPFFARVDICQALDGLTAAQEEVVRLTDCLTQVNDLLDGVEDDLGSDYLDALKDRS